jgi:chromosome segregation ATPase
MLSGVEIAIARGVEAAVASQVMNRLIVLPALIGLLFAGCEKPKVSEPTAAEKALAARLGELEEKVERLQQLTVLLDRRRPPVIQPKPVVAANTNAIAAAQAEHKAYEEVMATLADAVEGLQRQEQGMAERMQSITDAIISLEQAVLSIDAELRQPRPQQ